MTLQSLSPFWIILITLAFMCAARSDERANSHSRSGGGREAGKSSVESSPTLFNMEGGHPGETRVFGKIEFLWCPAGQFIMGSPLTEKDRIDDETQHRVTHSRGFWLARTECTHGQWEKVMEGNPSSDSGIALPINWVSWNDVQIWISEMNDRHPLPMGWSWALPTEAQWEYACRAGTKTATAFGDTLSGQQANFDGKNPYGHTSWGPRLDRVKEVGSYEPNLWGFHDVHGNVWEWCNDWYGPYPAEAVSDPEGESKGVEKVYRGGGFGGGGEYCRSAIRYWGSASSAGASLGFRPAIVSTP